MSETTDNGTEQTDEPAGDAEKKANRRQRDQELRVVEGILAELEDLGEQARRRVLTYLHSRFEATY